MSLYRNDPQCCVVSGAYVIRANDELHVRVYNEQELTGQYKVDGAGFVSIPLVGRIGYAPQD